PPPPPCQGEPQGRCAPLNPRQRTRRVCSIDRGCLRGARGSRTVPAESAQQATPLALCHGVYLVDGEGMGERATRTTITRSRSPDGGEWPGWGAHGPDRGRIAMMVGALPCAPTWLSGRLCRLS